MLMFSPFPANDDCKGSVRLLETAASKTTNTKQLNHKPNLQPPGRVGTFFIWPWTDLHNNTRLRPFWFCKQHVHGASRLRYCNIAVMRAVHSESFPQLAIRGLAGGRGATPIYQTDKCNPVGQRVVLVYHVYRVGAILLPQLFIKAALVIVKMSLRPTR